MLGLFGLMSVLLALISLCSYWISWDLQPSESRPSFARQARADFADLLRKCLGVFRNGGSRRRAALDAYANRETDKKSSSILLRSEHS